MSMTSDETSDNGGIDVDREGPPGPERSHPDGGRLLLFAESQLGELEARQVSVHLRKCASCRRIVSELERIVGTLREVAGGRELSHRGPCPPWEDLARYAERGLDERRAREVETHLARCSACLSEVSDLWTMDRPDTAPAMDAAVRRVIERLGREPAAALVSWAGRTIELVKGFVETSGGPGWSLLDEAPALALAREGGAVRERLLRWSDHRGTEIRGRLAMSAGGPTLDGAVTHRGAPASTVSVRLTAGENTRGPESLDSSGRFGPWPLSRGSNLLVLTGMPHTDGRELTLEIVVDDA